MEIKRQHNLQYHQKYEIGIKLIKYAQNLYTENCKTLLRDILKDLNKWRDILCSQNKRLNIVKMAILSKFTYRFKAIPIKISAGSFYKMIN